MRISVEILGLDGSDKTDKASVEINVDAEGLDDLIKQLTKLKSGGDHFHMMTPAWGMDDLSEEKRHSDSVLVNHLEVIRHD